LQLKQSQISHLHEEICYKRIEEQLQNPSIQQKILDLEQVFKRKICSNLPNAFWEKKKHIICLPCEKNFDERNIPTKATPTQMSSEVLNFCRKEIQNILEKRFIYPLKSPWSCAAFYINNATENECGVPKLVINYKPLDKVLQWIRCPIRNKRDLLYQLVEAKIFSKFDMKLGFEIFRLWNLIGTK